MSIETDLSRIAAALESIASAMSAKSATVAAGSVQTGVIYGPAQIAAGTAPVAAPQVTTPPAALTAVAAPFPTQPATAPIVAPAPVVLASGPTNAQVTPAVQNPVPVNVAVDPFGGKGLMGYAMEAYQAMGAQKGAQIQTILTQFGHQNINDLRPDQYVAFHAEVEKLKGAA